MQTSEFKFSNPKLITLNFQLNNYTQATDEPDINMNISIQTNIDKKNETEADVELNIEIGDLSVSSPFFINLVIGAKFKLDSVIEGTDFNKLLDVNAPALLLSYARPIISSVTNHAGMRPLNLPYINFTGQQRKDTN